jgi:hypothetical protein
VRGLAESETMFQLTEKRFANFFRKSPETGMGYFVVTAFLKDGRHFKQVVVDEGHVTLVRGYSEIPFMESDIDHFVVTHEKWDWSGT